MYTFGVSLIKAYCSFIYCDDCIENTKRTAMLLRRKRKEKRRINNDMVSAALKQFLIFWVYYTQYIKRTLAIKEFVKSHNKHLAKSLGRLFGTLCLKSRALRHFLLF